MSELPPLMRDQRKVDADHLKLLSVFHFVLAGMAVVGIGFLCLHWLFLHTLITSPELTRNAKGPPPEAFFAIFKLFYFGMGSFMLALGAANLISGLCILRRRARIFSLIVAGFDCMGFPFGTTLGVFTFIVLLRDSVVEVYDGAEKGPAGASSKQ